MMISLNKSLPGLRRVNIRLISLSSVIDLTHAMYRYWAYTTHNLPGKAFCQFGSAQTTHVQRNSIHQFNNDIALTGKIQHHQRSFAMPEWR